jgi:hypothetical protein
MDARRSPNRRRAPATVANVTVIETALRVSRGPRAVDRSLGVRVLMEEAHVRLPPDAFAGLAAAVRRTVRAGAGRAAASLPPAWPGLGEAARAYLRPVELLVHVAGRTGRPFEADTVAAIERHLDGLVATPRPAPGEAVAA